MKKTWTLLDRRIAYDGFFRVEQLRLRHDLFDGGESRVLVRELISHAAADRAVAVLPYDPVRDCVVLVRQFRTGAVDSQKQPWLVEIVAGLVDEGERVEETARRETAEETGCPVLDLRHLYGYYASPGGMKEHVSLYLAHVDSTRRKSTAGVRAEDEDIQVIVEPLTAALDRLGRGGFRSAPPILALQWLQANLAAVRAEWQRSA